MTIRIVHTDLYALPMRTRMPFRYGIATLTELPHLFVRVTVDIDGRRAVGLAADGLAPKWFTKNPATSAEHDIAEMAEVVRTACAFAQEAGPAASVFDLWWNVYQRQRTWGCGKGFPPLLSGFGASLIERALIDAFCRDSATPFAVALHAGLLGFRSEVIHLELAGMPLEQALPRQPLRRIIARHTVGLSDPLSDAEIPADARLHDGLPQSLAACARTYGLTHFKIKLCGEIERDLARLRAIAVVLGEVSPGYQFTLDGNEQFRDMATFATMWRAIQADPVLHLMLDRLLFVEQPIHRDKALDATTAEGLAAWPEHPPIIIDESDGALESLPRALACGYAGTSHKNCKGVFKGIANAMLIARQRQERPDQTYVLSGEDLTNVGPVALLQDLAVMATLGIEHVERNGHHYFAGLSMHTPEVQAQALAAHDDLYRRAEAGFPTLNIRAGIIEVGSLVGAPFGYNFAFDAGAFPPLERSNL